MTYQIQLLIVGIDVYSRSEFNVEKVTRGSRVGGNRWKAGCIGGSGVETGGNVYLDMESG